MTNVTPLPRDGATHAVTLTVERLASHPDVYEVRFTGAAIASWAIVERIDGEVHRVLVSGDESTWTARTHTMAQYLAEHFVADYAVTFDREHSDQPALAGLTERTN